MLSNTEIAKSVVGPLKNGASIESESCRIWVSTLGSLGGGHMAEQAGISERAGVSQTKLDTRLA